MKHPGQIANGYCPVVDCGTAHVACKFEKLLTLIDKRTGKAMQEEPATIKSGDSAMVKIIPSKQMVVEDFKAYPPLGRFAIRDMKQTVGVGIVKEVCKKK